MAENTIQLSQTIQWASFLTGNRPLTLQGTNDPALTSANMVVAAILSPPFKWRWNRNSVNFLTINPAGWQANLAVAAGYRVLDTFGHMQTVTTAGTTGGATPSWNGAIGATTTDNGVIWTSSLGSDYVQSLADFGFIEQAIVQPVAGGTVWDIPNKTQELTQGSESGRFTSIAPYLDDNQGNITFRFMPSKPLESSQVTVTYQKRMSLLTSLTSVWPIPDMYSHIFETGFLGMTWLFSDDPRSTYLLQRFAAQILAISDGLTEQEKNSFMAQWDIFAASNRSALKAQQAQGARAAS